MSVTHLEKGFQTVLTLFDEKNEGILEKETSLQDKAS